MPARITIAFALGAVLTACGGGATEGATAPERSTTTTASPSTSLQRVMVELRRGERSLASVVDRDRGLVHVLWLTDASDRDPRAGEDGVIRVATRLCGAELDAAVARFDADLQARNNDPLDEPVFDCAERTCTHRARMEYDFGGAYTFASAEPPVLDRVVQIEGALLEARDAEARRWAAEQVERLAGGTCGTSP